MKFALILLTALLSTLAHADLAEMHQKNCDNDATKRLIGAKGSCRIVIAPKGLEQAGQCTGVFLQTMACSVTFSVDKTNGFLNLTCGEDLANPAINQDMEAKGMAYNVATILTDAKKKEVIVNDPTEYKIISNPAISVLLFGNSPAIFINLEKGSVPLTDVKCR